MRVRQLVMVAVAFAAAAYGQKQIVADSPAQVRYAANLQFGESYIDIVNTGANGAPQFGPGLGDAVGNICANVYAFDPSETLIACCSCLITPDQVVNLGVLRDLTSNTLTGRVMPTSVTVKLIATLAGTAGSGTSCVNSASSITSATPVGGMAAWGTSLHTTLAPKLVDTTETAFTPVTMTNQEMQSIGGRCAFIIGNGSGFGICTSCRTGGLGARKQ